MKSTCPVCSSKQNYLIIERANIPVFQNIVISEKSKASKSNAGNLKIMACQECGFVYNSKFDANKIIYNQEYDNCQLHSAYFDNYVNDLTKYLLEECGIKNSRIIEIGCGQGQFLRKLVENEKYGNYGVGFDPSYRGENKILDGRLSFKKEYYSEAFADIDADVIVCRHVIEHVANPVELLKSIRKAVQKKKAVRLFFETPCVNWILENKVFWDFFYEHCSYFSTNSIRKAFVLAGFNINKIEHIFKGQYLWVEATTEVNSEATVPMITYSWDSFQRTIDDFIKTESQMMLGWRSRIAELNKNDQKIAVWGAGAKGVTFANLIDPESNIIDCIIDINPNKQGNYLPGTGHLITDIETAAQRGVTHAVVMNSNYISEIKEIIIARKISMQLIQQI